jgi:hypothetical protein
MSLKNEVMVVNLNISQWTARKYDAKVSREVEQSHNAQDAGRFNKILIASETLKQIQKIAGSARTFHYFNTLPWGDNGDRILPTKNYFPYITEMGKLKSEFEATVSKFVSQYPDLVQDAKLRLNTMFSETDYPPQNWIDSRFAIRFSFMPVSDSDDLRVNISDTEISRIKAEIQGTILNRVDDAVKEMKSRIREAVGHMADKLSDKDSIFRDSLVNNVCDLIQTIPLLNFNNDPDVNWLVEMIKPLCVDPEVLRNDASFRLEIAQRAKLVLEHFKS